MILCSTIPLHIPFSQMVTFCGIGFLLVMAVLLLLSVFTSIMGRVFIALGKK